MNRARQFTQALADCRDVLLVGGKAANLGQLMRAGFPVPGGFVVMTGAYRAADGMELTGEMAEEIRQAYRAMGSGSVAVRSSATAEDLAAASMAGQCETFLDIQNEDELLEAVKKCWESLKTERIRAYFKEHGIDGTGVAMAVVVQRLVSADVAGVLFTTNPHSGGGAGGVREMLVEASWGLGESVVSGRVQPDVLRMEQETGRVVGAIIADKHVHLAPGAREERPVEESRRRQACLGEQDVQGLWELGRRASEHFGSPQDIEWAIHEGAIYLLQSRPITTLGEAAAAEELLDAAKARLREEVKAGRGPWVLHNLAETLPHPTPLTWSVIKRFMSGAGGYGEMYRQAGFVPSEVMDREGFLELIGGRIYMDAARAPEMFSTGFPFAYDAEELKRSPDAAQAAPTLPRGSLAARLKAGRLLAGVNVKLHAIAEDLDKHLRGRMFPNIARHVTDARQTELRGLDTEGLIELWMETEEQVLDSMAPQLLMPSLISGMALGELRTFLEESFWEEDGEGLSQLISSGGTANRTILADAELYEVASGKRTMERWISEHGHRAAGEFDLAAARWREMPTAAGEMARRLAAGEDPMALHRRHVAAVDARIEGLRGRLGASDRKEFDRRAELVRRYVAFREDGKDFLMLGYDLLRRLALEAGRRLGVGADVFYLARGEMFEALRAGSALRTLIEQRKGAHRAEERLELARVIDAAGIDGLGKPAEVVAQGDGWGAYAVSGGRAAGPVRILRSPTEAGELGTGYILVCPSTDPSWTPLFVNAAGLVLERGGALSHGAVVAREMGLPAVVLAEATRVFGEGERVVVDGTRGWVGRESVGPHMGHAHGTHMGHAQRGDGAQEQVRATHAPQGMAPGQGVAPALATDVRVGRELVPPGAGRKDRRAAQVRNGFAIFWVVYLAAFFLLPARFVYGPTLALMDAVLWPLVRGLGRPGAVAVIAAGIAVVTLLLQKYATDNARLLAAKKRAAALQKEAAGLPKDSPRRAVLLRLAAPVQMRVLAAALVPVGILLGPLVMPFTWFAQRVDPAVWSAPAGSAVQVVAMVASDYSGPVSVSVPAGVVVDEATPTTRTLPPIRKTLERLLALYRQPGESAGEPWELKIAPDAGRKQSADELQAYLDAGIPAQGITWMIRPAEGMSGRIPVKVTAAGGAPQEVMVVLGDNDPPGALSVAGAAGSPVKQVRVVPPSSKVEKVFWRPFGAVHIGWLWVYVLVYVPTLLLARAVLKVA